MLSYAIWKHQMSSFTHEQFNLHIIYLIWDADINLIKGQQIDETNSFDLKKRHFKHFVKSYLHKVVYFFLTHFISYPKQRPTCFFCIWLTFGLISATIFKGDSSKVESIEHFRPHDNGPNVIDIWITIYLIPINMYVHSNHLVLQIKWSVCESVFFNSSARTNGVN